MRQKTCQNKISGDSVAIDMTAAAAASVPPPPSCSAPEFTASAEGLFRREELRLRIRAEEHFFWMFLIQWIAGIIVCGWVSPLAWEATQASLHDRLIIPVGLGGLLVGTPMALIRFFPGVWFTRHVVAAAQMLFGALLIQATGGRVETHFHVFGSLAFLAFYRDPWVLLTATVTAGLDQGLRSLFWPESAFGVATGSFGHALEHVCWMLFEDTFLFSSIALSRREMSRLAREEHHRLRAITTELATAQEDAALILATVLQGLFLLAPDLRIRGDYSRALESLLRRHDLVGAHFLELLRPLVSEELYRLTADYLNLMFDPRKIELLLARFNPLTCVEITFDGPDHKLCRRYLEFGFHRVQNGKEIRHLLVSVQDITERVTLQHQVLEASYREKRQLQMALEMLMVRPRQLERFVSDSREALNRVNQALCGNGKFGSGYLRDQELRSRLAAVLHQVRAVRAYAEICKLTFFADKAVALERRITELQKRPKLDGEDFLPITVGQAEMVADLQGVTTVLAQLLDRDEKASGERFSRSQPIPKPTQARSTVSATNPAAKF
ncbi:MAG: hypothetical protein JO015_10905 [Verrucomicrobia bacterium]|nr:hypothetical protein [Verrucomicrobiota bacterium]